MGSKKIIRKRVKYTEEEEDDGDIILITPSNVKEQNKQNKISSFVKFVTFLLLAISACFLFYLLSCYSKQKNKEEKDISRDIIQNKISSSVLFVISLMFVALSSIFFCLLSCIKKHKNKKEDPKSIFCTSFKTFIKRNWKYNIREAYIINKCFNNFVNIPEVFQDMLDVTMKINKALSIINKLRMQNITGTQLKLHRNTMCNTISALRIYFETIISASKLENNLKMKAFDIESNLFNMAFTFKESSNKLGYNATIYPVYLKHETFTKTKYSYLLFQSSTGSGKTRCAPFFFTLRSVFEGNKRPFFIITQPSTAISLEKAKDLKSMIKNDVTIIDKPMDMIKLYHNKKIEKPVVGIFSPFNVLKILRATEDEGLDIYGVTRFCLDEIHERSIETDALLAKLSEALRVREKIEQQVLLMSATPDPNVMKCFRGIKTVKSEDSTLFNVDVVKNRINYTQDAPKVVSQAIADIINDFKSGKVEPGHILSFLPGNLMINQVMQQVYMLFKDNNEYRVLNNFIKDTDKYKDIVNNLVNEVKQNENKIILLPIKLAGFVPFDHKRIAQNPIPRGIENKVIKVICATNAVESSITIENLAAVVDSGLYNMPNFDIERGITSLKVEPITEKMQTQRKGRVGRTRSGRVVQITIKGKKLPKDIIPSILATDLSSSIITLRRIGINLEELKYLPDNPGKKKFNKTIKELEKVGVLNRKGILTDFGKEVALLENISPSYAFAIINTAKKYSNEPQNFVKCYGAFIVFIMTSKNIIGNSKSKNLQKNFCPSSDIVTIAKTFLDCLEVEKKEKSFTSYSYGFQEIEYKAIVNDTKTAFKNYLTAEEAKVFWESMRKFFEKNDILKFVNNIVTELVKGKPLWKKAHTARFNTIIGARTNPRLVYEGDNALAFPNSGSFVVINERPGTKGLLAPKNAIIFQIERNSEYERNFGTMIHSLENYRNEIGIPEVILEDKSCLTDFYTLMINSYIYEEAAKGCFSKMNIGESIMGGDDGLVFHIMEWNEKVAISFIPKTENASKMAHKADKVSNALLPFTPRSILIHNSSPNCAIEVYMCGSESYMTSLHFLSNTNNLPQCFNLTKNTMNFLYEKKMKELAKTDNFYRIAVTGEALSYSLDDDHCETFSHILTATRSCSSVFGKTNKDSSRVIVMIANNEEAPNEKPLNWFDKSITAEYVEDDFIINAAGRVAPGLVRSYHKNDMFLIQNGTTAVVDKVENRAINSIKDLIDNVSMNYAMGRSLKAEIPYKDVTFMPTAWNKGMLKDITERLQKQLDTNVFKNIIKTNFGCLVVETKIPVPSNKVENTISLVKNAASKAQISYSKISHIPITCLTVVHNSSSSLSEKEFVKKVTTITKKFHFICTTSKYVKSNNADKKHFKQNGCIFVTVIDPNFAITIAGEIKGAFVENKIQLKIPETYVPKPLVRIQKVRDAIQKWCKDNHLRSICQEGYNFVGSKKDVQRALILMSTKEHKLQLPLSFVEIPSTVSDDDVKNIVRIQNRVKSKEDIWVLDSFNHGLIVKTEDKKKAEKMLNRKKVIDNDVIGCINYCEDPTTSSNFVTIYNQDGSRETKRVCLDCIYDTLEYSTADFFSHENGIDFTQVMSQLEKLTSLAISPEKEINLELWPKVPLGQLLWALLGERKVSSILKAWLTGIASQTLHVHPNLCTFCPDHPYVIIPIGANFHSDIRCTVPGCTNIFCCKCFSWHKRGQCQALPNVKRCPQCGRPTIKEEGCNHITCPCGAHWCYKCQAGPFASGSDCYKHMSDAHNNWYN